MRLLAPVTKVAVALVVLYHAAFQLFPPERPYLRPAAGITEVG